MSLSTVEICILMPETNALLQARFEVDPQRVKKASEMFVERRTRGIRIIPQKVVYTIPTNHGKVSIIFIISVETFLSR